MTKKKAPDYTDKRKEYRIIKRFQKGDTEAAAELIAMHNGFLWMSVNRLCRGDQVGNLTKDDLYQIACLGLIHAAERFETKQNVRFLSYARWWIHQYQTQELCRQSRVITLSHYDRDIAWQQYDFSLNTPLHTNDETSIEKIDVLPGDEGCERLVIDTATAESLLSCLSKRDAQIMRHLYGISDTPLLRLSETGVIFGITRERTRQIKELSLERIRRRMKRLSLGADTRRVMTAQRA